MYGFINFDRIKTNHLNVLNSPWTWYHVRSINLFQSRSWECDLHLLKQIKIKLPKLISITFNSFCFRGSNLADESDSSNDGFSYMFINIDSVTTVYFGNQPIENMIQWLSHYSPNVKDSFGFSPITGGDKITEMFIHLTKSDYIYSHNVEHVQIEFWKNHEDMSDRYLPYRLVKILEIFQNSKMVTFYFR